jgi:hypothetical protein
VGIEPTVFGFAARRLAVWLPAKREKKLENRVGFEPTHSGLKIRCLRPLGDRFMTRRATPLLHAKQTRLAIERFRKSGLDDRTNDAEHRPKHCVLSDEGRQLQSLVVFFRSAVMREYVLRDRGAFKADASIRYAVAGRTPPARSRASFR